MNDNFFYIFLFLPLFSSLPPKDVRGTSVSFSSSSSSSSIRLDHKRSSCDVHNSSLWYWERPSLVRIFARRAVFYLIVESNFIREKMQKSDFFWVVSRSSKGRSWMLPFTVLFPSCRWWWLLALGLGFCCRVSRVRIEGVRISSWSRLALITVSSSWIWAQTLIYHWSTPHETAAYPQ